MGLAWVKVRISNPVDGKRMVEQAMLVDSGAVYSVIPQRILRQIGIKPIGRKVFTLADGSRIKREIGIARLQIGRAVGGSTVIFGKRRDKSLLGVVTLEDLGLAFDPVKRKLKPLPLLLA